MYSELAAAGYQIVYSAFYTFPKMQLLLGLLIYLSASAYNKPMTNKTIIKKRLVRKGIEEEIVKCTNILNWHTQIAIRTGYANRRSKRRKLVPSEEFKNCTGIAILRLHLGSLSFGKLNGGTGLVLRKLDSGSWSAPSAFRMAGYGLGIGWQVGYEMNEIIIYLNTKKAVDMFYKRSVSSF